MESTIEHDPYVDIVEDSHDPAPLTWGSLGRAYDE